MDYNLLKQAIDKRIRRAERAANLDPENSVANRKYRLAKDRAFKGETRNPPMVSSEHLQTNAPRHEITNYNLYNNKRIRQLNDSITNYTRHPEYGYMQTPYNRKGFEVHTSDINTPRVHRFHPTTSVPVKLKAAIARLSKLKK